jgi:hypothetical protein
MKKNARDARRAKELFLPADPSKAGWMDAAPIVRSSMQVPNAACQVATSRSREKQRRR